MIGRVRPVRSLLPLRGPSSWSPSSSLPSRRFGDRAWQKRTWLRHHHHHGSGVASSTGFPYCTMTTCVWHWQPTAAAATRSLGTTTAIFMSSVDDEDDVAAATTTTDRTVDRLWNLPGLKKEVQRLVMRCHKKVGKASQRLQQAQATVQELTANPDATMKELEECPDNMEALEMELKELQKRLVGLNTLEDALAGVKGKKVVALPPDVAELAFDLGVDDQPPQRPQRGPPKPKGPRGNQKSSRLPYRRYYTVDNVEIRVGKQAEDNDELSLSPQHRDGTDWWMHASGCPGSHVVIRTSSSSGANLAQSLPEEVVQDAAALAARQSKCHGNTIKVSLTRCRDVVKPPGAKAGLVQLVGNVRTVVVNMKEAQARLDRLDATVLVN